MNLYTKWRNLSDNHSNQQEEVKFWEEYLKQEAAMYNNILNNKQDLIEGKVSDLAAASNISIEYYMGFIDGISESLKEDLNLESIEADTTVTIKIDWEKLYYNMLAVEAHWLYNLKGWDGILSVEKRRELQKLYNGTKTVVKETKVGRNDACICGSGKKYKKCCGKQQINMFILKFVNEDDDLSIREFETLNEVKSFINDNNLETTWHELKEVKKVIPNFKQD